MAASGHDAVMASSGKAVVQQSLQHRAVALDHVGHRM